MKNERTERRKFRYHSDRKFAWLTKRELSLEVEPEDLEEIWSSLERKEVS